MSLTYTPKSIFWATFATTWTVTLASGMGFLWLKRDLPFIKVRGIGLSFVAIAFLHVYYLAIQYAQLWTSFPEQVEYWVMGIYLPVGIALFHASNSRFLHVARQQRRFAGQNQFERVNWLERRLGLHRHRYSKRMAITVGVCMGVQIFFILLMYLMSRKFHSSFGIPGTEVSGDPWEINSKQAVGWEWWPSIVWQLLWSWVFAPVVLYRARNIHDTLGWRTQTIACCIANLPATPMWVIALYVDGMSAFNPFWIPPQWIATSIFFLELFTVFIPCWQAYRHKHLRQETLALITAWEAKTPGGEGHSQDSTSSSSSSATKAWTLASTLEKLGRRESLGSSYSGESLLSMGAMEHLLQVNPEPLRHFSALKDFSGENVAFLTAVAEWKRAYPVQNRSAGEDAEEDNDDDDDSNKKKKKNREEEALRDAYTRALRIYTDFISLRDADFPINISFQDMAKLESVFEKAARILFGRDGLADPATPFDCAPPPPPPAYVGGGGGNGEDSDNNNNNNHHGVVGLGVDNNSKRRLSQTSQRPIMMPSAKNSATELRSMVQRISYWGEIPGGFDAEVFDQAEANIKYLVLTNTWPKFVQESRHLDGSLVSLAGGEEGRHRGGGRSWVASVSRMIACSR